MSSTAWFPACYGKWKVIEENSKSLQTTSQKLLDGLNLGPSVLSCPDFIKPVVVGANLDSGILL